MATAHKVVGAITVVAECVLDGMIVLETTCKDFDHFSALPQVVSYKGVELGKSGWSSDSYRACYKQGIGIAHSVTK